TMRPRGSPPMPRARSSESEPVETAPTDTAARSFIFITAPLPKFRSIWPRAASNACSRSTWLYLLNHIALLLNHNTQTHRFEDDVLRSGRAQHGKVSSSLGRHHGPQLRQRRAREAWSLLEAAHGDVREPAVALGLAEQVALQPERQPLRALVPREDEHGDAACLAIPPELERRRRRLRAAAGQRVDDLGHPRLGLAAEEGEGEVEVVARDGPPSRAEAGLPGCDRVGGLAGEPEPAEEPERR